jgi:AraC family transcriptional regulator, positive regulator of tynA and feaB
MRKLIVRSTDEVAPEQRVRYWRDAVHEAVVEMDLLPSMRSDFHSEIELCPLSNIVPHQARGSPQKISRNRIEIARGDKNAYYLISQARLPWRSSHAGHDRLIKPGESVLIDSRIPYSFTFDGGFDDLSVELPVHWVERWLADPHQVVGRPIPATEGWGLALRGAKEALVPRELVGLGVPDELIEDQLGALLGLASGLGAAVQQADCDLYERCLSVIRSRMTRPGLVASEVAQACSVSLRTVHRTFAAKGRTFAGVLVQLRVDEATRLLADRRFRDLTIAEIGRRCGFLDASHFARQFRRLRKMGPREFRKISSE